MDKKHLEFYKTYFTKQRLPDYGLCTCAKSLLFHLDKDKLDLFRPTEQDIYELRNEGFSSIWWGYGIPYGSKKYSYQDRYDLFTPLRQTIVLFLAAMNGELN